MHGGMEGDCIPNFPSELPFLDSIRGPSVEKKIKEAGLRGFVAVDPDPES